MKIRTKAPNFTLTKQRTKAPSLVESLAGLGLAREYDVDIENNPILSC
jgi:hypothetical protein